ncbi:flagellar basal body rod protein FlgB [Bordetella genomosp. 9]|uniref:Flagellar basal body rod protein FlgB n=1 Tax=Bordetella genomosp. 9 TaxID=1416803 RepID=A0A1W6Z131_9BORD|nr:flagellar basal body rod protein FlgB [Bordetella genomosp. 9]ARP86951.1 flagellar basal body rod protein FlgB [Bordetella genomosp. 9]ARP92682.1 flagellar basal body rod protein FlgB [Bordetella genomosp. 9]
MIDRLSQDLGFFQQSLDLRAQRQEILSANIANADTPNYKARDFDFRSALESAMGAGMNLPPVNLALTSPRHIAAQGQSFPTVDLLYREPYQASLDGNTVDMDAERVQFADNTLHYQSTSTILSAKIKSMLTAISE